MSICLVCRILHPLLYLIVIAVRAAARNQLGQEPCKEQLTADHQHQDAKMEQRARSDTQLVEANL